MAHFCLHLCVALNLLLTLALTLVGCGALPAMPLAIEQPPGVYTPLSPSPSAFRPHLRVHFIDVGQGDSILSTTQQDQLGRPGQAPSGTEVALALEYIADLPRYQSLGGGSLFEQL